MHTWDDADLGYASREEAIAALRAKPGVTESSANGWLTFRDQAEVTWWTFSEEGNPSHPTVVKRRFFGRYAGIMLETRIKCGASKEICAEVAALFAEHNKQMRERAKAEKR